jgi:hypothetical protein
MLFAVIAIKLLTWMFFVGLVGSTVVVLISLHFVLTLARFGHRLTAGRAINALVRR